MKLIEVHRDVWKDPDTVRRYVSHVAAQLDVTDVWYRIVESENPDLVRLEIRTA